MAKKASRKTAGRPVVRKAKKAPHKAKKATSRAGRSAGVSAVAASAGLAAPGDIISRITAVAAASPVTLYPWKDRGRAPAGYLKGMAVTFARVYCKLLAGDGAAAEMAKADTQQPGRDALSWYAPEFQALGWSNATAGADTLRHLFVLLIGLGMRESSGKHCEGRDVSASNTTADTAEAGLFQTSYNARSASPLLPQLFANYRTNPAGFVEVFRQGVTCSAASLQNFGTGDGKEFQRLSKESPAFAAEFAAVALRSIRKHWGPITTKKSEVLRDCDTMLRDVQGLVVASPGACSSL